MAKRTWLVSVVLMWATVVWAQSDASNKTKVDEIADTPVQVIEKVPPPGSAVAVLAKYVKEVNWDETPFGEIVDWLREQGDDRINVIARWPALRNEGVDEEKTVTLKLTNATVAQVLNEVLENLSPDDRRLRYQATENWIRISTQADFDRNLVLRVYHASDILFRVPDFTEEAPQIDLSGQNSQGGGGGGGGGGGAGGAGAGSQSVFSNAGGGTQQGQQGQTEQEIEQATQRLKNLILRTVAPDTWEDVPTEGGGGGAQTGGTGRGRIQVYNRTLVVLNTLEVHEQLAGWFDLSR